MTWTLLVGLVVALGLALLVAIARRVELARMERGVRDRETAVRLGAEAQLQHPIIDLSRCLGCATCVAACPETGVLELVHGQAAVVNGARCAGISACERECPVGAITVTLTNLEERTDIPALTESLEAVGAPGLFLAGEVTAHALIKTAVEHGTAVAAEVARRVRVEAPRAPLPAQALQGVAAILGSDGALAANIEPSGDPPCDPLDLVVVGAGPAGLACSLEARRLGLSSVTLEQEPALGGTVAKYPRRKLVLTEPVELPLHGRLTQTAYTKEELMELWQTIAQREELPIRCGTALRSIARDGDDTWLVETDAGVWRARNVCLALGRRGRPNQLGVPGESLPKVAYALLDAHSYEDRRVLVVGGGDSAVETALALAEQPGNEVALSYRREAFVRVRSRNAERLEAAVAAGRLRLVLASEVRSIRPDTVELAVRTAAGTDSVTLANDDVFVMAGGTPPFELLSSAGVSFDPAARPQAPPITEQGPGLVRALAAGFGLALLALLWAVWHADYYLLPTLERPAHPKHAFLRPGLGAGLGLGVLAAALVVTNLLYLVRRSPRFRLQLGSLQSWMTIHVATGVLAFLCALLHGAMAPRDTVGGHALWSLLLLLVTGAIGRYFYAWVPRAANGRELALSEAKVRLSRITDLWDQRARELGRRMRDDVLTPIHARQWKSSFPARVLALVGVQRDLARGLGRLEREARAEGIADEEIAQAVALARRAHRAALVCAHYEDLRAVLNTWRYLHRWVALLMVVLIALHVFYALTYGAHFFSGGGS